MLKVAIRKSIDGLCAIIADQLKDPASSALFPKEETMASSAKDIQLRELKDTISQLKIMVSEQTELIR